MFAWGMGLLLPILLVLLFAAGYTAAWHILRAAPQPKRVIRLGGLLEHWEADRPPSWLAAICGLRLVHPERLAEWKQLLQSAGIRAGPLWYLVVRRSATGLLVLLAGVLLLGRQRLDGWLAFSPTVSAMLCAGAAVLVQADRAGLAALKRYRAERMVEEIFDVCRQLLYFHGSPLHLHGKLTRCLAYTKLIRSEWHMLLNDWYQDSEYAIRRFRDRLGTEEAHAFAETLQSLRLYDGDAYYELIRQRVMDYKERLELIRDSRKESASYGLFVLAGIPILYTFQIFIYPWVQEGIRLFGGLNG